MERYVIVLSLVVGALLPFLAFAGFAASVFQLGTSYLILPVTFTFGGAALGSLVLAKKYEDADGITWYGRYGETPAGKLLWAFLYASCLGLAGVGAVAHLPGIGPGIGGGKHYIPTGSPLITWITKERQCVNTPDLAKAALCTLDLCNATRRGNKSFADLYCLAHPETCDSIMKTTSLDWAIDNCLATCGCSKNQDPFNPLWNTAADITFECEHTGSCNTLQRKNSVTFLYVKFPTFVEIHVATGVFIMLLVPLQLLKSIRMWKDKLFHRWNGRLVVLLVIPNQITAAAMVITGIANDDVALHSYTTIMRVAFGLMTLLTCSFVSCAIYQVKVTKNIPKHGEFMMRATATWFAIPFFKMLLPFLEAFIGNQWNFCVGAWLIWLLPLFCTEVYIRKSGRFVTPSHKNAADTGEGQESILEISLSPSSTLDGGQI